MSKKKQQQPDDNNYYFLLKSMAAITAAAVATAGVIAVAALKPATIFTATVAAKTLFTSYFMIQALPISLAAIGIMFLLPCLFSCRSNAATTTTIVPSAFSNYGNYRFYTPTPAYNGTSHGHASTSRSVYTNVHSHSTPHGNVHGHSGGGNRHGHI
jgi:hypothetical protein